MPMGERGSSDSVESVESVDVEVEVESIAPGRGAWLEVSDKKCGVYYPTRRDNSEYRVSDSRRLVSYSGGRFSGGGRPSSGGSRP